MCKYTTETMPMAQVLMLQESNNGIAGTKHPQLNFLAFLYSNQFPRLKAPETILILASKLLVKVKCV